MAAPQNVFAETMRFEENGGGTYSGSVALPAGALIHNIMVYGEALWTAATSASLEVGDAADPDGYFTAIDLKANDLTLGQGIDFYNTGGQKGAYVTLIDAAAGADHTPSRVQLVAGTAHTVTATVVSDGAGTAGRTNVTVLYSVPTVEVITQ